MTFRKSFFLTGQARERESSKASRRKDLHNTVVMEVYTFYLQVVLEKNWRYMEVQYGRTAVCKRYYTDSHGQGEKCTKIRMFVD